MQKLIGAAALCVALSSPVHAGPAGDLLRDSLYSGALANGVKALEPLAAADPEARFGMGALQLVIGVERLAQTLYRHGLSSPNAGPMGPNVILPLPPNPNPEPWGYDGVRQALEALVADFDAARAHLEAAGAAGDYVIIIDPTKIHVDVNADGNVDAVESISGMMRIMANEPMRPGDDSENLTREIGFDRADAIWLAGYSDVIAAQAEFLLAHDFSDFVNTLFHRFFPKAGFPMEPYSRGGQLMLDPETDSAIADVIAAVHSINWPVTAPERLKHILTRLKEVTAYSRRNLDAVAAETDDNHELLPSPKQASLSPGVMLTEVQIAAWRESLDTADKVFDGALLVPHWRFKQGFDLKAYFETAKRTDLVLILTGYGAVPFLRDGPVASPADFAAAREAFGDNWLGYVFWFN
jgi:hypothetical protein